MKKFSRLVLFILAFFLGTLHAFAAEKLVALTFDDGPSPQYTERLLDILKKNNVHATFFVIGKNAEKYPKIVAREHTEGHEIGSHTWSHPNLKNISQKKMEAERDKTDAIIKKITGETPKFLRPPYGNENAKVRAVWNRPLINWSVDTLDWKYRSKKHNIAAVNEQTKEGSIILFHDIHKTSVDSIQSVIDNLKAKGYKFVTVSELLAAGNDGKAVTGQKVCYSQWNCTSLKK